MTPVLEAVLSKVTRVEPQLKTDRMPRTNTMENGPQKNAIENGPQKNTEEHSLAAI
jgi:hypothetical protein